jgi:PIN domain nuclease of toxin-antitoxin system
LLDTHALLWFIAGDKQLPGPIKELISDIHQPCYVSIASLWEVTIKIRTGRLQLGMSLEEFFTYIERNEIEVITVNTEHLLTLAELPDHHNDPFDRIIVSQAISEQLTLISRDKEFKKYKVRVKW